MRGIRSRDRGRVVGGIVVAIAAIAVVAMGVGVLMRPHDGARAGAIADLEKRVAEAAAAQAQTGRVPPEPVPLGGAPVFEQDPNWPPKSLPNNWVVQFVGGVGIDSRDHPWFLQTPTVTPPAGKEGAPPVLEFDTDGTLLQAWGGPLPTPPYRRGEPWKPRPYQWMELNTLPLPNGSYREHALTIDYKDNVWVAGNGNVALKFTRDGKFLLQIGELWQNKGSNDTKLLGGPTLAFVDQPTDEVYIADGYINHRVIVFDANTGAYKRHWGAYGKGRYLPDAPQAGIYAFDPEGPIPQHFSSVHCAKVSKDRLVYVCDRDQNRIQVFKTDGTFVSEFFVDKAKYYPHIVGHGTAFDVAFSADPEQRYLYVADFGVTSPPTPMLWIYRRSDLRLLGSKSLQSGNGYAHAIAVDSKGNLYTASMRKFLFKGVPTGAAR